MAILYLWGPIVKGVLALSSLPFIPLVKRASHGASVGLYVLAGAVFPLVAVIVDPFCMHPH